MERKKGINLKNRGFKSLTKNNYLEQNFFYHHPPHPSPTIKIHKPLIHPRIPYKLMNETKKKMSQPIDKLTRNM
jgi:hypothetical protein